MQRTQLDTSGNSRLRFVFSDRVISLKLATDATFEDIARSLESLAAKHSGKPVAIDVTFGGSARRVGLLGISRTEDRLDG
jgi:hypothetical protein